MRNNLLTICAAILFVSGCASNDNQYYWGEYENLVYKTHHTPGEVPPSFQIEQLQTDIEKAEAGDEVSLPVLGEQKRDKASKKQIRYGLEWTK